MMYVRDIEIFEKLIFFLKGIGDVVFVLIDRGCLVMLCEF